MTLISSTISPSTAESSHSAVSWGAIIAGAVAAAAITLLLTLLGSGLGLSMASVTGTQGSSVTTLAVSTAIWLIVVQWLSSGFGGYITGRLRTKWSGLHNDEVFFRDTAHGVLSWALATLLIAGTLGSVVSSTIGSAVQATATLTAGATTAGATAATSDQAQGATSYFVDSLLRPANPANVPAPVANDGAPAQIGRILVNGATTGTISADDRAYLSQLVASRTGLSEADAQARIDTVLKGIDDAKATALKAADDARKASAAVALIAAISLLIGGFIAGVGAAIGGRERDYDDGVHVAP